MGPTGTDALVARVLADAERAFGRVVDAGVLASHAREATLDLWIATPGMTVRERNMVLRRVLEAIAREGAPVGGPLRAVGARQDDPRLAAEGGRGGPRLPIRRAADGPPLREPASSIVAPHGVVRAS